MAHPISVVSSSFCTPDPIDLAIVRHISIGSNSKLKVTDINGNILYFKVKRVSFSRYKRQVLLDAVGNPIVTLRMKPYSRHSRWQVFRGDSKDNRDLIFSVKRASIFQFKTKLNVFLARNTREEVCDFKLEANWNERSCSIYLGDSSTIIAKMHKKLSFPFIFPGSEKIMVTVSPNIDYAFIVALIVILDDVHSGSQNSNMHHHHHHHI